MCGRFAITLPVDAMVRLFAARPANDLPAGANFSVCPTDGVAVIHATGGQRHLDRMRWGFVPEWYSAQSAGPLLINARAETLAVKPAFRAACRQRRCLIPATGFYEWTSGAEGRRLAWYFYRRDGAPIAFAGIWQRWQRDGMAVDTCAIVTTAANPAVGAIHHRMPLIVEQGDWPLWLGEVGRGAATLMVPGAADVLGWHRVGDGVNSNRASGAALVSPIGDQARSASASSDG